MRSIVDPPPASATARFDPDFGQRFLLTIEIHGESDGGEPRGHDQSGARHVQGVATFQAFCENEGVAPVYLLDEPSVRSDYFADVLRRPLAARKAEAGALMQPDAPDAAAITRLCDAIERQFCISPVIYRTFYRSMERYVASLPAERGVVIDSSVRARFDCGAKGGPDYRRHPPAPYWLDDEHRLLELPLTAAFWGPLRRQGEWLHPALDGWPALREWLARASLLERIALTPEGVSVDEAIRAIDISLDDGLPLLVFSFSGASLRPEHSPADPEAFYDWWRRVFAYLELRGIAPATIAQIREAVRR